MVRWTRSILVVVACALATLLIGCAPSGPSTGADGGAEGEGEGEGEAEAEPFCRAECTAPADCVIDNAPPHIDEDNYACNEGACEYLGCLDEGECDALGASADTWTCYQRSGFDFSLCVGECATASDCAPQSATGAQDADNYECDDGACWYIGCHDDDECVTSIGPGARCVTTAVTPFCAQACDEPADCVSPAATAPYDADNFTCVDGVCDHIGCLSDEECDEAAAGQICR